ncbi:MAG TPA: cytochrome c oxidase assembly protein [Longimicrobiales bacterium]|nr:cytochrome c oxidase assembly protein [Longimicrobiales bacterium]
MTARRALRRAGAAGPLLLARAAPALAHEGRALEPHDLWGAWTWDPALVVPLVATGIVYALGVRRLWRRGGVGRGIRRGEAAAFAAGWVTLVLALVSPLHALSETLFSAHMAQHTLLLAVAAPLLVLGRPMLPFLWALPLGGRRRVGGWGRRRWLRGPWRALTRPLPAFALQAVVLWAWHAPALYDAALASDAVHALEHATFLLSALLFWWSALHVRERGLGYGAGILSTFATGVHSGALGALLALAARPLYPAYAAPPPAWGLTPLEDQQLAGFIMWMPGGLPYLVAALALLVAWMQASERSVAAWERAVAAERGSAEGWADA